MITVRKIAVYALLGTGLIILIGGILFVHGLTSPVKTSQFSTTATITPPPGAPTKVSSSYASFSYPSSLKTMSGLPGPTGDELAVYNYTRQDIEPWHLSIVINQLNQSTLSADSSYLLRLNDPSMYQKSNHVDGTNTFTIMTDAQAGDFTEVAYVLDGYMSADISLTGNDPSGTAALGNAFNQILASWQWR